jgi:hypothetical protein
MDVETSKNRIDERLNGRPILERRHLLTNVRLWFVAAGEQGGGFGSVADVGGSFSQVKSLLFVHLVPARLHGVTADRFWTPLQSIIRLRTIRIIC